MWEAGVPGSDSIERAIMNFKVVAGSAAVGVIAVATIFGGTVSSAAAPEPDGLTPAEQAKVVVAMIDAGSSLEDATTIASDPEQAQYVPVSTSTSTEKGKGASSGDVSIMTIGSSCNGGGSGYQAITRSVYNVYGNLLVKLKTTTRYCYSTSRVTYAWNEKTATVSTLAAVGGWFFEDYPTAGSEEAWGSYSGHANGLVRTHIQGSFGWSPVHIGNITHTLITLDTTVRYNGTSTASSNCSGAC